MGREEGEKKREEVGRKGSKERIRGMSSFRKKKFFTV